jgi:uncharacterized protein YegL
MSGECLLLEMFMLKPAKPAAAGVAVALSLVLGLGMLAQKAEALAIVIFSPPPQAQPAPKVAEQRLAEIANYDVIVFIDSSRSMSKTLSPETRWSNTPVYPLPAGVSPSLSRWQWCSEQTENLSEQLQKSLKSHVNDHLKVVLFSDNYKVYKDVDLNSVPTFFASNHPYGNTNANAALRSQFRAYFDARDKNREAVRPLLVAMITDGCPDDPLALRQTIIDATNKMQDPNEIAITFLQVGIDPKATKYLRELDDCLVGSKARFDIVTTKSFDQVNQSGLAIALLDAVHK